MMIAKLSLLLLVSSYGSTAPTPFGCTLPTQNISVTSFWTLPLSNLAPGQNCNIRFLIPSGYFAIAAIIANGVPDLYQAQDTFTISDDFGTHITITNKNGTIHSNIAWPSDFNIAFKTSKNTEMTLQMSITVNKVLNNDIVSSVEGGVDKPSNVLYLDEWKEGTSIVVSSQSNRTQLFTATAYGDSDEYNNIFVYNNGILVGTMRPAVAGGPVDCNGQILVYMAKQTSIKGAILAVDNANVESMSSFTAMYVPLAASDESAMIPLNGGWDYDPIGVTVIGNRDGSTPIDVRSFHTQFGSGVTYVQGGPSGDFASRGTALTNKDLPVHLSGNINTFYNMEGQANLKITIS